MEEGKRDVAGAKATGAEYLEQAKDLAAKATATAQVSARSAVTSGTDG